MAINYKRIGERVSKARKDKKMTIGELAQATRFTTQSITFVEEGKAALSLDLITALCTALSLTPNDLLEGEYCCDRPVTLEYESALSELKELIGVMREDLDLPEKSFETKDSQTAIEEFRTLITEYRMQAVEEEKPKLKKRSMYW